MRRATRSAWVTVQRAPIPLHRRPVRRSLTGWLPRQKKRHSARSRRIHAPVIPRPSVIAGLTRNLVILRPSVIAGLTRNLVLKCVFGYTKARFKGLAKNISQVVLLFALVNLHRVRKKLMAIKERQECWKFKAEVRLKTA